eukprot:8945418-Pyramimonas_sp.AAC.2
MAPLRAPRAPRAFLDKKTMFCLVMVRVVGFFGVNYHWSARLSPATSITEVQPSAKGIESKLTPLYDEEPAFSEQPSHVGSDMHISHSAGGLQGDNLRPSQYMLCTEGD